MKYKLWCRQREIYSHNELIFNDLEEIREILIDYHSVDCDVYTLTKMTLNELLDCYDWEVHNAKTEEFIYIKERK